MQILIAVLIGIGSLGLGNDNDAKYSKEFDSFSQEDSHDYRNGWNWTDDG